MLRHLAFLCFLLLVPLTHANNNRRFNATRKEMQQEASCNQIMSQYQH